MNTNQISPAEKKLAEENQLKNVIKSLERVPQETKQMIFDMATGMSDLEIMQSFNQQAFDTFTLLIAITIRMGKEKECKVTGYKVLFDNAVKINKKLPLDKFTLIILEYAAEIYAEEEDCFLNMEVPDTNINVGNEFGIFRSEMFKKLWKIMNSKDKKDMKDNIILLTTFAHTYLYKTILKN